MPQYFDPDTNEETYTLSSSPITAFKRFRQCNLDDWTENNRDFLYGMMKMAFEDGIEVGKTELRNELTDIHAAIDKLINPK